MNKNQELRMGNELLFINELTDFCLCDLSTLEEHKGETGLISLSLRGGTPTWQSRTIQNLKFKNG